MEPTSTYVRYESRPDGRLLPVRITKAWVRPPAGHKGAATFVPVRITELRRFPRPESAPEPWESDHRTETRERLLSLGNVRPEGHGEPCLRLDDPAKRWAHIVNRVYDWERTDRPLTNSPRVVTEESTLRDDLLDAGNGPVPQE